MLSHVQLFTTTWTVASQAPLFMEFPRQDYWSGLPFPPPGDLPDPGIEPMCLASPALAGRFFTTVLPKYVLCLLIYKMIIKRKNEDSTGEWEAGRGPPTIRGGVGGCSGALS